MKNIITPFILFAVFILMSCKNELQINQLKWMEGSWIQLEQDGSFEENWQLKPSDSGTFLVGKGIWLKDSTVFTEYIHLYVNKEKEHFLYRVMDSSDEIHSGTVFTSTEVSDSMLVFENPKHDFPKKIIYQKINDSLIHATVLNEEREIKFVLNKQ
ncbi:MAG: DUF6265 family protein [Flavobacterium sp.]